jgi:hypothetical protein
MEEGRKVNELVAESIPRSGIRCGGRGSCDEPDEDLMMMTNRRRQQAQLG